MFEEVTHHHTVKPGSERALAFVLGGWFVLLGLAPLRHGLPVRWWSIFIAAALVITGIVRPALLKRLNIAWVKLGLALNRITSPVILAVIFCVVVVPTGLLMRAFGRSPLLLKRQPGRDTYWRHRARSPASSMFRQF